MRRLLAAAGAFALFGFLRRRRESLPTEPDAPDPRAEELRRKLAESRSEPTPEQPPAVEDPETRRRAVHTSARETVEQMRRR